METIKPLSITSYLSGSEIERHLENVEFIIMAAPSMMPPSEPQIHFTFFLNTSDPIPQEIRPKILEKFCQEHGIRGVKHLLSNLERVAFAQTSQETPMPRHLIDDAEANTIPWRLMHIIDFVGESENFPEAKEGFSGWSYSYN